MPIQISETKMYCITHEAWGTWLVDEIWGEPCIWVHSAPPELPKYWELVVQEPSEEELAVMDENAKQLLLDLTGTS